ncbi:glycosyl transferase family 2 [Mucilaginibacter frigoritolerans]|uniref:Glycosyl transferase family 2 n=2 Tax=Mucilaginibacter frigoritolerans TaxID=652788 RepID=A0A562TJW2_9SPHI|nr:glycosyl transferase family 2 [Mucilaginibacter frigoritolerans]
MVKDLTIAIPTYNRNDFLIKILDTIPNNELVVISDNGGSVTEDIINKHPGFLFVKPPEKLEMFENWNFCINKVQTKWFIIPSDDDLFYVNAFSKINAAIEKYDDADIIIFGHNTIDEFDNVLSVWSPHEIKILEKPNGYNYFKYGVEARLPSIIFKTDFAKSYGFFDESYVFTAADSLLIQKCMLNGKAVLLPDIISAYRIWQNNFTSKYISSKEWLLKIDKWQDEIAQDVKIVYGNLNLTINSSHIKDEVYANNLLAGIVNKKSKYGFKEAFIFVKSVRFPWRAKFITKLKIIKALLIK